MTGCPYKRTQTGKEDDQAKTKAVGAVLAYVVESQSYPGCNQPGRILLWISEGPRPTYTFTPNTLQLPRTHFCPREWNGLWHLAMAVWETEAGSNSPSFAL